MENEKLPQGSPQQEKKLSVIDISKKARQRLRSRRFSEARSLFSTGLEMEPENPYLLSGMGDACRELRDYDGAEKCYTKLLDIDTTNLFALRGLGDVYKKQERHSEAIALWDRYLILRPQDKHVMTRIADSYKALQQFDKAENVYQQILDIAPRDRYALTGLGDLLHRMGKDEQAIRTYERVLSFDENELHILTIIGKLCWRITDFESAELYFRRALKVDPDNPYALYGLGNCCRWHRKYEEAIAIWMKILETSEGTQALHTRMGDAYYHLGQFAPAESSYLRALNFGSDPFSTVGLICLYAEQGEWSKAFLYFIRMIEDENEIASRLDLLVKRFVRSGQRSIMLDLFQKLINEVPLQQKLKDELEGHLDGQS